MTGYDTLVKSTRLAAIMFTDIAGYSRLMEEDEPRTIELIRKHNDIVFPVISISHGEVVDAIGDGLLVMFPSVLDAVTCGLSIQKGIAAYSSSVTPAERFYLRIGVHLGEIWQEENRVYGNGVNIAARVQPFSPPGGMCVSDDVYRQVVNKTGVPIRSIGEKELKNISRKIELYLVKTGFEDEATVSPSRESTRQIAEFDEIKEKLLVERERIALKRHESVKGKEADDHDLGKAIENRVFSFVERVMDTAIDKWDKMPEEKKKKASVEIDLHHFESHKKNRHKKKENGGSIGAGVVFGVGFGIGFFVYGVSWMIWPFLIIGVLPFLSGVGGWIRNYIKTRKTKLQRPKELEREVLSSARSLGGRVTVVQIAADTNLSLDEVSKLLDTMTVKGYVIQNILENGVIEYEFPQLLPPKE